MNTLTASVELTALFLNDQNRTKFYIMKIQSYFHINVKLLLLKTMLNNVVEDKNTTVQSDVYPSAIIKFKTKE